MPRFSSSIRRRGDPRRARVAPGAARARARGGALPAGAGPHRSLGHAARRRLRARPRLRRPPVPDDVTATAGAGFRAYLRNGPKATWTAQVLPEYVWWQPPDRAAAAQRPLLSGLLRLLQPPHPGGAGGPRAAAADRHPRGAGAGELPARRRRGPRRAAALRRLLALRRRLRQPAEQPGGGRRRSGTPRSLRLLDRDERVERAGAALAPRPAAGRWRWGASTRGRLHPPGHPRPLELRHRAGDRDPLPGQPLRVPGRCRGPLATAEPGGRVRPLPWRHGRAPRWPWRDRGSGSHATLYSSRNLVYSLSPVYAYFIDQRAGRRPHRGLRPAHPAGASSSRRGATTTPPSPPRRRGAARTSPPTAAR